MGISREIYWIDPPYPADWVDTLFAPLAAGGSMVFVRNCTDEAVLARRMEQERATVRI